MYNRFCFSHRLLIELRNNGNLNKLLESITYECEDYFLFGCLRHTKKDLKMVVAATYLNYVVVVWCM